MTFLKLTRPIRKFFGMRPRVGDPVRGYMGYGMTYDGVVIKTDYKSIMPSATVKGTITSNNSMDRHMIPFELSTTKEHEDIIVRRNELRHK